MGRKSILRNNVLVTIVTVPVLWKKQVLTHVRTYIAPLQFPTSAYPVANCE